MAKNNLEIKLWLIKRNKRNRRIPLFVVAKSGRKVVRNKFRRNWRRDKLLTRNLRRNLKNKN